MNKIYRIMGKRGRITIPEKIRIALKICSGDLLSFTVGNNYVVISKEKLCDYCKMQENQFETLVKSLTRAERDDLFKSLMKQKRKQYV